MISRGTERDGGDLARFCSRPRGMDGGAAAGAQAPPGSRGGGARDRRTSPSPRGHLEGESSQFCTKPGSFQSPTAAPSSTLSFLSLLFSLDSRLPLVSALSPPRSPHLLFLLPLLAFPSPLLLPSFLLHRTRRVSFIYLFITPAINTLLGLPSFSM